MLGYVFFRIISFLSSFIGVVLLMFLLYFTDKLFFLGELTLYSFLIGLFFVTVILFFSKSGSEKRLALKSYLRSQNLKRKEKRKMKEKVRNRFFSGHIARAFLLGFILFQYNEFLIFPMTLFCALVILSMMRLHSINLRKILLSALLGSISGLIAVNISNFLL